jgi:nucleoside-triphosphatase THEP1
MDAQANSVWRRAAVYGSLWAAVEVVVGSFLHNLRIPFAGGLLGAVGVMLMTAGHRAFPERGLIWRSAVVCALMKSVSPSAVIIGPMIGIAMEGLLLEAMVRLSGGRLVGYLLGGALAVSWSMVQRIGNALIAFGPDVVRLYVDAYQFASRSLGVSSFGPFDLVAALAGVEMIAGCAAAGLGWRMGRHVGTASDAIPAAVSKETWFPGPPIVAKGSWSLWRLALVTAALVLGMACQSSMPLWAGGAYLAGLAAFVLHTYPRAAARIRRPSLWIELTAVMLLAGLVFGGVRHGLGGLVEGASAGVAMAIRATMVLFGFTAISVELRNPVILAGLERRRLRGLSDALGVAFGVLPAFTSALAEHRGLWRQPSLLGATLLRLANGLVLRRDTARDTRATVTISGATGAGKTTLTLAVIERLRARGASVAGIVAPGLIEDGHRIGFDIVNLRTGERVPLAREQQTAPGQHARWNRFAFTEEGLALGHRALGTDAEGADVVVVDEVGPFELAGGGWAGDLDVLRGGDAALVLVVRSSVLEEVRARWAAGDGRTYSAPGADPDEVAGELLSRRSTSEVRHQV